MLDACPQLIYTFSRVRQDITGPKRTYVTRISREGDPNGPVYHTHCLAHAKQFDSEAGACCWRAGQPPEVREAMDRLGFTPTAVVSQVVPMPMIAPAGRTAGLSDEQIDAMALENAIDDASDILAAEALDMTPAEFRHALAVASEAGMPGRGADQGMDPDIDRDSRASEMGGGCPCRACVALRAARAIGATAAVESRLAAVVVNDQVVS